MTTSHSSGGSCGGPSALCGDSIAALHGRNSTPAPPVCAQSSQGEPRIYTCIKNLHKEHRESTPAAQSNRRGGSPPLRAPQCAGGAPPLWRYVPPLNDGLGAKGIRA
eukprot:1186195-Prorocentrum_minimum.AAC.1